MAKKEGNETPLMQQYYATKAKYPDAILLYRMGDFYETFGADAITTSRILGITLTKRSSGSPGTVELAGFPYHAIDTYLPKLVRAGQGKKRGPPCAAFLITRPKITSTGSYRRGTVWQYANSWKILRKQNSW